MRHENEHVELPLGQPENAGKLHGRWLSRQWPLALMHEFRLSGMRVGATTAVVIDQIARADAATLGLFGTGKQARCALEAVQLVRPIRRVEVNSPSAAHRAAFAHDMSRDGIAVEDPRNVVAGADIVCCTLPRETWAAGTPASIMRPADVLGLQARRRSDSMT